MEIPIPGFPIFPSRQHGKWGKTPAAFGAFNSALHAILSREASPVAGKFTSHSLKTTLLAWSASFGLHKDDRATLGYHRASKDSSVRTYARDTLTPPVKKLSQMLSLIRDGKFDPESKGNVFSPAAALGDSEVSPTQMWGKAGDPISPTAPFVPEIIPADEEESDDESCILSSHDSQSDASTDEDRLFWEVNGTISEANMGVLPNEMLFQHWERGTVHRGRALDPNTSHCGTPMDPSVYHRLASGADEVPEESKCDRCFKVKELSDYVPAFDNSA